MSPFSVCIILFLRMIAHNPSNSNHSNNQIFILCLMTEQFNKIISLLKIINPIPTSLHKIKDHTQDQNLEKDHRVILKFIPQNLQAH